ncbi:hypothetical protein CONPUDRAFT_156630 [Coniophora puteana RWD-64-598 SS2]|uniref:Uncharacterized protein n=1 Tax=Coniophora puteana (strain RWD-64-598) TaxID=741705 RepID=A0A5M3MIQ5_CONPW|nr:uncharacterized protein CONPUDRAFT_156630 [Coniophora puteana RWD-64-598 SS2]EIW78664.1 hypothetical protein CONPUDRAFT_156630 [Coniophora puteana RWD-64-598 SS2]
MPTLLSSMQPFAAAAEADYSDEGMMKAIHKPTTKPTGTIWMGPAAGTALSSTHSPTRSCRVTTMIRGEEDTSEVLLVRWLPLRGRDLYVQDEPVSKSATASAHVTVPGVFKCKTVEPGRWSGSMNRSDKEDNVGAGVGAGVGVVSRSLCSCALSGVAFGVEFGVQNDISRAEDLSTKLRTLTYDHERLTSMHRSAKEQAANAEREMNVHKSRLATTTRTLHTAESAHKHTTAKLQRTRTSIQALRASHTSELKKKERDVERMTEKWTKLAEAQSKLSASGAASGMTIRGTNADVVTGSEVLWQGRTVDEEALEQAEQARAQLYEENGRLRRLVISSANELQRVVWNARSLTCDAEEEPQPLTSVELFPIAPVGAANDRFAAMFTALEDTLAYLPERLANGELATRSMKSSKSGEEQLLPKANFEAERLQGIIDSLQAELDETRKLHQAQAVETQELYEQLSAQQVQHDGDINAGADEAREELASLRVQIEEERRKLAKEKAAFEADRIRLRNEKRSFQADQMLSPPPQPAPALAPAASTSRRHAPVPKPALASPHAKSPPRKYKPPAIAVRVAKAKAEPGLGTRGSKRTVGRRLSAAFNTHANASISSRHEPAYETEVIPETISAAAFASAGVEGVGTGAGAGAGALGLGAPAFELPKRRESILPTSFVLPPPSPRTSLPPTDSIPFSLLPPETPLAGYVTYDQKVRIAVRAWGSSRRASCVQLHELLDTTPTPTPTSTSSSFLSDGFIEPLQRPGSIVSRSNTPGTAT